MICQPWLPTRVNPNFFRCKLSLSTSLATAHHSWLLQHDHLTPTSPVTFYSQLLLLWPPHFSIKTFFCIFFRDVPCKHWNYIVLLFLVCFLGFLKCFLDPFDFLWIGEIRENYHQFSSFQNLERLEKEFFPYLPPFRWLPPCYATINLPLKGPCCTRLLQFPSYFCHFLFFPWH